MPVSSALSRITASDGRVVITSMPIRAIGSPGSVMVTEGSLRAFVSSSLCNLSTAGNPRERPS